MTKIDKKTNANIAEDSLQKIGFFKNMRTDKIYRNKWRITLCCALAYGMYGWQIAQFGTALPELQQFLNVDLDTISWMFTTVCIGMIVSGFSFGFLYDRFNRFTVMVTCLVGAGILHGLVPVSTSFPVTLVLRLFNGFFAGGIETGMVTIVSAVWGTDGAGYIHATYISFRIGGFIGPLVTNPFMSYHSEDVYNENKTDSMGPFTTTPDDLIETTRSMLNRTDTTVFHTTVTEDESRLLFAFMITCTLTLIAAIPFICMIKNKTYETIGVIEAISVSNSKQISIDVVKETNLDIQHALEIRHGENETLNVPIHTKTKEVILEISNDMLHNENENVNYDTGETIHQTEIKVTDSSSIAIINDRVQMRNRHQETKTAVTMEPDLSKTQNTQSIPHKETDQTSKSDKTCTLVLDEPLNETSYNDAVFSADSKNEHLQSNTTANVNNLTITEVQNSNETERNASTNTATNTPRLHGKDKILIIVLIDILVFFMSAGDDVVYNFLPTFCFNYLNWSFVSSSTILSVFNIIAIVCGVISIVLARVLSPSKLMFIALIGWNVAILSRSVANLNRVDLFNWIRVSLIGAFMVMVPATAVSWLQTNVCPITGKISASLTLAGGIGMASTPNVIGYVMQTATLMFYWYTQLGFAVLSFIAFGLAFLIQRICLSKQTRV